MAGVQGGAVLVHNLIFHPPIKLTFSPPFPPSQEMQCPFSHDHSPPLGFGSYASYLMQSNFPELLIYLYPFSSLLETSLTSCIHLPSPFPTEYTLLTVYSLILIVLVITCTCVIAQTENEPPFTKKIF